MMRKRTHRNVTPSRHLAVPQEEGSAFEEIPAFMVGNPRGGKENIGLDDICAYGEDGPVPNEEVSSIVASVCSPQAALRLIVVEIIRANPRNGKPTFEARLNTALRAL